MGPLRANCKNMTKSHIHNCVGDAPYLTMRHSFNCHSD
jgi:hypothetical protein